MNGIIENPTAYEAAKIRRIKANARTGRERKFDAAYPGLREKIKAAEGDKRVRMPYWIPEALHQWGGLTDKQAAVAIKVLTPDVNRDWDFAIAEDKARSSVAPWTPGRQNVTGQVLSARWQSTPYGESLKALLGTEEGRKLWTTVPSAALDEFSGPAEIKGQVLSIRVTVEPKAGDPLFAFGSRPSLIGKAAA